MIEDSPYNVQDLIAENIQVLLYTQPWNRSVKDHHLIHRVNSWKDVLEYIEQNK